MSGKDIAAALFVVMVCTASLLLQKYALSEVSVYVLTSLRLLPILPFVVLFWGARVKIFKYLFVGVFWCVIYYIALSFGLQENIGAGQSSFLLQAQMFCGIIFCYLILGDIPKKREVIGMLIASVGIVVLSLDNLFHNTFSGVMFLLTSCVAWGFGLALLKKLKIGGTIEDTVWLSGVSSIPMVVLCFAFEGIEASINEVINMKFDVWMCILYVAFITNVLAGAMWIRLTQKFSAATVSPYMLILPVTSSLASSFFAGETFSLIETTACGIILIGVSVSQGFFAKFKTSAA